MAVRMKSTLLHVYIYWVHILQIPASKSLYELPFTMQSDLSFLFILLCSTAVQRLKVVIDENN